MVVLVTVPWATLVYWCNNGSFKIYWYFACFQRGWARFLLHCLRRIAGISSGPPEEFCEIVFIASMMSFVAIKIIIIIIPVGFGAERSLGLPWRIQPNRSVGLVCGRPAGLGDTVGSGCQVWHLHVRWHGDEAQPYLCHVHHHEPEVGGYHELWVGEQRVLCLSKQSIWMDVIFIAAGIIWIRWHGQSRK